MITQVLLGVDPSQSSQAARDFALGLAAEHAAAVDALAVIDTPWITGPMAVGIGGAAYKVSMEVAELRRAHAEAEAAMQAVRAAASAGGVPCEVRLAEGHPFEVLAAEGVASDVIVLGRDAAFWGKQAEPVAPVVHDVLRQMPRPTLVLPPAPVVGGRVLVAFDGSLPASRALHMMALLGIATKRPAVILSIAADKSLAAARAATAERLLRAHGALIEDVLAIESDEDPAGIIINHVQSLHIGLVAMGAYGHTGLREMLFGSCTHRLLRSCPSALLVYH